VVTMNMNVIVAMVVNVIMKRSSKNEEI